MPNNTPQTASPAKAQLAGNPATDTEYVILENIYGSSGQRAPLRQRDLAQITGASLGMTNSILKRLAQKGWITAKKLNSRNIQYAITLDGINEIIHRSYSYFKRTIRNVVYFKDALETVVSRAALRGIRTVALVGASDLDFIIEHACRRWGLHFLMVSEAEKDKEASAPNTLKIYAENIPGETPYASPYKNEEAFFPMNYFYLSRLIIKQASIAYGEQLF